MQVEKGPLEGLLIVTPQVFADDRGFFFESFNAERFAAHGIEVPFVQDNHVRSVQGTLRGLHFQRGVGQAKLVRCTAGRIWDVAVDIRPDSPTFERWFGIELTGESKQMFFVPVGFAHGYAVLSEWAEVLYKCSNVYVPELEYGFRWNDAAVGVDWKLESPPLLSKRDVESPSFEDCMSVLAADRA